MQPDKTFLKINCRLFESEFDVNNQIKMQRVLQFMQDAATAHGETLGVGWNVLDKQGLLWVLGKVKVVFHQPVDNTVKSFDLYTWPLAPTKVFAERCYSGESDGQTLFSATSLWLIINRDTRKIVSAETMNRLYGGEYCRAHCETDANFRRVRRDDSFILAYKTTVRRSLLDKNGHVNNTDYANLVLDVLPPQTKVSAIEIVYQKELHFGDNVKVYAKVEEDTLFVVGEVEEPCFTAVVTLSK